MEEEEATEKGWPGHRGNLSPSATCGASLWQCLLMWQMAGAGRDGRDDGAGAQRRLRQLCKPSSARISPVQTSLCFIPPSGSELGGTGARFGKEGCREAGGQQGPGRPWKGGPFCPPSPADVSRPSDTCRGCRAAPAWVPQGAGRCWPWWIALAAGLAGPWRQSGWPPGAGAGEAGGQAAVGTPGQGHPQAMMMMM